MMGLTHKIGQRSYFYSMKEEQVILVNEFDVQIGTMPKMEAHEKAALHRAFSIFIMNSKGEIMLQQRAANKYHSPLLWTNTCCSHQREGESNVEAGKRRLLEEMGFVVDLVEIFSFIYKAPFDNGLTEHELDHVMIGYYDGKPVLNLEEVANWKWMKPEEIKADILMHPEMYTAWFKIIFEKFYNHLIEKVIVHESKSK
jgi:isopentenyl-diphosphate delta-isomerase